MLTDIFAYRYADRPIWNDFREADRVLLVQGFRMVLEQLFPPGKDGKMDVLTKNAWDGIHRRLSMELGLESLSPLRLDYRNCDNVNDWGVAPIDTVCKTWMLAEFKNGQDADAFMKARISFLELAFRECMLALEIADARHKHLMKLGPKKVDIDAIAKHSVMKALGETETFLNQVTEMANVRLNAAFISSCRELNERFRRAKCPLNYHNGYIQIETDEMVQEQITAPFWKLVSDSKWKNVEIDMMEAVDRREANDRDPAFYAAKALESAIKIISDSKLWSTGKEKGASQFIDNLRSSANGTFIVEWEADALRHIFSKVRNELGHGPGTQPITVLSQQQTDWVIEAAMSWIKSLIGRL